MAPVLVTVLAMAAVLMPLSGTADAKRSPRPHHATHSHAKTKSHARTKAHARTRAKHRHHAVPTVPGQPRRNYVIPATSYFSFPNRSKAERMAIRNRVLLTIQSVWGGRRSSLGLPLPGNGTIRIATWSFDDWDIAKALVAAQRRGVSVQVVAAKSANVGHTSWRWLRKHLGSHLYRRGYPSTADTTSFARSCRGACRGPGGTPHSKYFLFDNVGASHARKVVVQTSMNLTWMAYWGQWNQAQVVHSYRVYDDFMAVFRQTRIGRPVSQPYHVAAFGPTVDYFFPRPRATAAQDPVMQNLNRVSCAGTAINRGRTMIRVIQYAIYDTRGVWIAKKLRALWNAGCDVAIIYAVSSRPVLSILRNRSGRGAVPMRQSVVTDPWGNIVKYNHSKWMTITGHWAGSTAAYVTFNGSANWANLAFGDDEQMQRILGSTTAARHLVAFTKTWRQKTSTAPTAKGVVAFGRMSVPPPTPDEPTFGVGIYRYLPKD
jgi:phosphatidylserine/phosphatidylglycerophosphate/cardiolipin synthase-like enzyme